MIRPVIEGPCGDEDPDLFFGDTKVSVVRAKKVCATCPLQSRAMCLTWAIEMDLKFGVFGGLTRKERDEYAGRAA